jgi:erythromycin esterase-like protein
MGLLREELNIGQLCRESYGAAAALIGFGTHTGTVAAANDWDAPMRTMHVLPSRPDSYEYLFHESGLLRCLADLREQAAGNLREQLRPPRLERFIGVIYRPQTERFSHYAEASLAQQFDGYVWFDHTHAVTPLPTVARTGTPDTYPFGE